MSLFLALVVFYTLLLAFSQILLKWGVDLIGSFKIAGFGEFWQIGLKILKNPFIIFGIIIMVSSFFLWLYILSRAKLGIVFPLTALTYVFVALLSYFILGERVSIYNYLGIFLVILGIAFLLHR